MGKEKREGGERRRGERRRERRGGERRRERRRGRREEMGKEKREGGERRRERRRERRWGWRREREERRMLLSQHPGYLLVRVLTFDLHLVEEAAVKNLVVIVGDTHVAHLCVHLQVPTSIVAANSILPSPPPTIHP